MGWTGKRVVVTGGSRGLGRGLVEALAGRGAEVTVVARGAGDLAGVGARPGVHTVAADAADADVARRVLATARPSVVVLNAGETPPMERIDRMTWAAFSAPWNSDVQIGLHWVQAALTAPLAPGSVVLLVSSGAAIQGSPLSGGYAGAKRALWFLASYADALSQAQELGITFKVLVPRQMVPGTGVGDAGIAGYAAAAGVSFASQAEKWPAWTPAEYGDRVADLLDGPALATGRVFAVRGDTGVTVVE
jgi:NAD(P)-dependent dehydrogenase (short-subunit alcohol dehydrogenase family)